MPSCASWLANSRADSAAISGPCTSSRCRRAAVSSFLVSAAPCGEVWRICATSPPTTASSSEPAQAAVTRPSRAASGAPNVSPVR
jgi:hypothetical protein